MDGLPFQVTTILLMVLIYHKGATTSQHHHQQQQQQQQQQQSCSIFGGLLTLHVCEFSPWTSWSCGVCCKDGGAVIKRSRKLCCPSNTDIPGCHIFCKQPVSLEFEYAPCAAKCSNACSSKATAVLSTTILPLQSSTSMPSTVPHLSALSSMPYDDVETAGQVDSLEKNEPLKTFSSTDMYSEGSTPTLPARHSPAVVPTSISLVLAEIQIDTAETNNVEVIDAAIADESDAFAVEPEETIVDYLDEIIAMDAPAVAAGNPLVTTDTSLTTAAPVCSLYGGWLIVQFCDFTPWAPWLCQGCCNNVGPPATRRRKLCCQDDTDIAGCHAFCHIPVSQRVESVPCGVANCPSTCPTTTAATTTITSETQTSTETTEVLTSKATTEVPQTEALTTEVPTTEVPTTEIPETEASNTKVPTTEITTDVLTTEVTSDLQTTTTVTTQPAAFIVTSTKTSETTTSVPNTGLYAGQTTAGANVTDEGRTDEICYISQDDVFLCDGDCSSNADWGQCVHDCAIKYEEFICKVVTISLFLLGVIVGATVVAIIALFAYRKKEEKKKTLVAPCKPTEVAPNQNTLQVPANSLSLV